MIFLVALIVLCIGFDIVSIYLYYKDMCNSAKPVLVDSNNDGESASYGSNVHHNVVRVVGISGCCYVTANILLRFAIGLVNWSANSAHKEVPDFVYAHIVILSIAGGAILTYGVKCRSDLFRRIVWWLFPIGVLCYFWANLQTLQTTEDMAWGHGITMVVDLPLFLEMGIVAYIFTWITQYSFSNFKKCK